MRCGYRKLYMESLEIRWVLSFLFGHTDVAIEASDSVTPGQNGPREDFGDAKPFKLAALDARSGNGGGGAKGGVAASPPAQ